MKSDFQPSTRQLSRIVAWFLLLSLCLAAFDGQGQIIPADRLTTWIPGVTVGVAGGIPTNRTKIIDVTLAPYNADKTGASDAAPAIQSAITAAPKNAIVFLPAGTYRLNTGLSIPASNPGITVRGSGYETIVQPFGTANFVWIGNDDGWGNPSTGNQVTAGLQKGSTQVTIATTSAFTVGKMIQFSMANDPAIPVVSVAGYDLLPTLEPLRRQICVVTGISSQNLSFYPPLYDDYSATTTLVNVAYYQGQFIGLENMKVDCVNSTGGIAIFIQQCLNCWVKGLKIVNSANYPVFVLDSLNCEIRDCDLGPLNHSGTNGAGILINTDSGCLIENNVIVQCQPSIEVNQGASGNVFAYNYCTNTTGNGWIDSNHAPHNNFNLYEGNIGDNFEADGYFGSVSHDTLYRNWFTGQNTANPGTVAWCVQLKRFTRNYSLVGNILGTPGLTMTYDGCVYGQPNIGNWSSNGGFAPPWADSIKAGAGTLTQSGTSATVTEAMFTAADVGHQILILAGSCIGKTEYITAFADPKHVTTNTSMTVSASGYRVAPSQTGYQEIDRDVKNTTLLVGNYNYHDNAIPSTQSLSTETVLVKSLYRSSVPNWFGNLTWPPFDPRNPSPTLNSIPASYRYVNGSPPPGISDAGPPLSPPGNLRIQGPLGPR